MNLVRKSVAINEDMHHGNKEFSSGMNKQQLMRYSLGFAGSVLLTVIAYLLVTATTLQGGILVASICILAVVQFFLQMVFFLHLGEEARPRWRLLSFIAMAGVLLLIVFGSIWIMNNLDYHMMSPGQTDQHMKQESNKGF